MPTNNPKRLAHAVSLTLFASILIVSCSTSSPTPSSADPVAAPASTAVALVTSTSAPSPTSADPTSAPTDTSSPGPVSFSRDLFPLFNETCIKCHGGEKTEKGLDMNSYSALMAGSERGAVIVPGEASQSRLAQLVVNGKMPKRGPKLTSEQVQLIVDWINAGAQNN